MAHMKLNVLKNPRTVEAVQDGIVVDEPAWIENIELGNAEDPDPAATAWALVEQLEEEQLRLAAELQAERQLVARLKTRLAACERLLARLRQARRSF
jgi:hypothetical protein